MRTVTYGGAVSLDGFLTGADGSIDWIHFSRDVQQEMTDFWKDIDTILMGRKTYAFATGQGSGAKPKRKKPAPAKAASAKAEPAKARTRKPKEPAVRTYVFSRTLEAIDQPGVELVRDDAAAFVRDLKQRPGKGIFLMGGGDLAQTLIAAGLVDEFGLSIHPLLLGGGAPVFRDPGRRVSLKLTECRPIDGGCILAKYTVVPVERA